MKRLRSNGLSIWVRLSRVAGLSGAEIILNSLVKFNVATCVSANSVKPKIIEVNKMNRGYLW